MKRLTLNFWFLALAIGFICSLPAPAGASRGEIRISGKVLETSGEPVVGATVILKRGDSLITGAAGDIDGVFTIRLNRETINSVIQSTPVAIWTLSGSSIGFAPSSITVGPLTDAVNAGIEAPSQINDIVITLKDEQVTVEGVTVIAGAEQAPSFDNQRKSNVAAMARRGVSVTNPIEAVRAPEVSRSGSAFSSQIRFSGSNPDYTLNGVSIGHDPAHYGMFSVLPSVAISEVAFSDQALDAREASPGKIELTTDRSFSERSSGELTLSALEAVGGYHKGTERWFVNAALRKSVLDKIVERFDSDSERRTIPPTNFEDVFVSSGVKLSSATSLYVDQYHTQDFLAFNTQATVNNSAGIDALQHTRNRMFGAHLRHITPSSLLNLRLSARFDKAIYRAHSTGSESPDALSLDMLDNTTTLRSDADIAFSIGDNQITSGATVSRWSAPDLSLSQRNWNFQPPFSTSDNPHYLQPGLNLLYGDIDFSSAGAEGALFTQIERSMGAWRVRGGVRLQMNSYLIDRFDVLGRVAIARRLARRSSVQFAIGTYAESPVGSLIEPYQVLIRHDIASLKSVRTRIAKVSFTGKAESGSRVDISLFAKRISDLPTLTPEFLRFRILGIDLFLPSQLRMASNSDMSILGSTLSISQKNFLSALFGNRMDIRMGYAYTHNSLQTNGTSTSYSDNAPHRFELDAGFSASQSVRFSGLFTARSGYRYTPPFNIELRDVIFDGSFYESQVASENSARFPAHINLNLSVSHHSGSWTTVANVGNALNRANPIVSAHDGFVYDASLLPSVGVTYSF